MSPRMMLLSSATAVLALTLGCATVPGATASSPGLSAVGTPSASMTTAAAPSAEPVGTLAGRTIVIDPGHTGAWTAKWGYKKVPDGRGKKKACNSSGTATRSGYAEHTYNFAQAKALATELRSRGATVVLTRTDDKTKTNALCVNHRADKANSLKADLMISLHADGNLGKSHRGFHIIISTAMRGGKAVITQSKALAKEIRTALAASTVMPRSNYIGRGTAYSLRSDLGTLNFSQRPAVMMEMGNMRNTKDAKLFRSSTWRTKAAVAVANGIESFLS